MTMETAREDIRDCLANRLVGQAEWRETVAMAHPEDPRNARAASEMRACAAYVRDLPEDDYRLVELDLRSQGTSPFMYDGEVDEYDENRLWGLMGFFGSRDPSEHLDAIYAFYVE